MKQVMSGLVAAFLLSAGFVAVTAETAAASCAPSSYVPCERGVVAATHAKKVKKGAKPKAVIKVRTPGNVKVKGTLSISIKGPGVKKTYTLAYTGKPRTFVGPKLKRAGTYTVTILFKGRNMGDSKTVYRIKVTKK